MPDNSYPQAQARSPRARLLAVAAALVSGVLVAGCGGSGPSHGPSQTATVGASAPVSTAAAGHGGASSSSAASDSGDPGVAFAECMRSSGVPDFPDPKPGTGAEFPIPAGTSPAAPALKAAQAKCRKLVPLGLPGSQTHPSAQTLAKLVKIASCMRRHGVPQFPDPRASVPPNPSGYQEITNFDGAILLFPRTINLQSPAYKQALTACGAPPLGLPH